MQKRGGGVGIVTACVKQSMATFNSKSYCPLPLDRLNVRGIAVLNSARNCFTTQWSNGKLLKSTGE